MAIDHVRSRAPSRQGWRDAWRPYSGWIRPGRLAPDAAPERPPSGRGGLPAIEKSDHHLTSIQLDARPPFKFGSSADHWGLSGVALGSATDSAFRLNGTNPSFGTIPPRPHPLERMTERSSERVHGVAQTGLTVDRMAGPIVRK